MADIKFELELTKKALRLREVDRLVVRAVIEGKTDALPKLLEEFIDLKDSIKLKSINFSVVKINDKSAQEIIRKINSEEFFQADKMIQALASSAGVKVNINELEEKDVEELGDDTLYEWFDPYKYVKELYSIGSLILGISAPNKLKQFVSEARYCYAFQQYNAVYSLCRTILEVSIRDICVRKKLIRRSKDNVIPIEQANVSPLINKISGGDLRDRIKDIYYSRTSVLIHGHKTITPKDAREMLRETLKTVQELYAYNQF